MSFQIIIEQLPIFRLCGPKFNQTQLNTLPLMFVVYSFTIQNNKPVNNLALLYLFTPIDDQTSVVHFCQEAQAPGTTLVAVGLGSLSERRTILPEVLHQGHFTEKQYFKTVETGKIELCPENDICTNPVNSGTSIGSMDDGGGLFALPCDNMRTACLYGVASYAVTKTQNGTSIVEESVFAATHMHLLWILSVVALG